MSCVDILLATYNGAQYLPEQLASLTAQTHEDWRLLVRDDGSTDETLEIVREWASSIPQSVDIIEDGEKGLGASLNFARLMAKSTSPYFACCDQDDVWLPEKLETMIEAVKVAEKVNGPTAPILAFADLIVVDEHLRPLANSFWALNNIDAVRDTERIADLMVRNVATGCATMGNAALLKEALPIPDGARMHDWWLAMTALGFGELVPVRRPLIKYRQHGKNAIGATDLRGFSMVRQAVFKPKQHIDKAIAQRDNSQRQAAAFVERFGERLNQKDRALLQEYGDLADLSFLDRKRFMLKHRIGAGNPVFRIALAIVS